MDLMLCLDEDDYLATSENVTKPPSLKVLRRGKQISSYFAEKTFVNVDLRHVASWLSAKDGNIKGLLERERISNTNHRLKRTARKYSFSRRPKSQRSTERNAKQDEKVGIFQNGQAAKSDLI